jgi:hypothetical protein
MIKVAHVHVHAHHIHSHSKRNSEHNFLLEIYYLNNLSFSTAICQVLKGKVLKKIKKRIIKALNNSKWQ